jgi:hypothetical protein
MKNILLIVVLTISVTFIGCTERGAVISGTVKFQDGTPVTSGEIAFTNGKFSFFGSIKADGTYIAGNMKEAGKIPQGNYTVYLSGVNKNEIDIAAKSVRKIIIVDPKFCSPETSDLAYSVKTGGQCSFNAVVPKPEAAKPKGK